MTNIILESVSIPGEGENILCEGIFRAHKVTNNFSKVSTFRGEEENILFEGRFGSLKVTNILLKGQTY